MVKFSSALLVLTTLAISVFASPIEVRDVDRVKVDLKLVATDVTNLDNAITNIGFSLSLSEALALKTTVDATQKDIVQSTVDVKLISSVSESDAREIMGEVSGFIPTIIDVLKKIESKKQIILSFPFPGATALIHQSLQAMHVGSTDLANCLINAAPADLKAEAIQMKTEVDVAFVKLLTDFNAN